ncbi:MAG: AsmA family protein [Betaproteobacteria bacterium]
MDPSDRPSPPLSEKSRPARAGNLRRAGIGIAAGLVLACVAVVAMLLVDANILRKPIAAYVGHKLDRPFAINGDLRIRLFGHPRIEANDVVLGNFTGGSRPVMGQVARAVVGIRLLPLLRARVVLPFVELSAPDVLLERDADGRANWNFAETKAPSDGPAMHAPVIESLWIKDGKLAFRDPPSDTDVVLQFDSDRPAGDAEGTLRFTGTGSLRSEEFHLSGHAASLLDLTQAGKPYRLEIAASAGATRASFDGTLVPLELESIDGKLELSGKDLSSLYPLIPVVLPWTPAYRVAGHFTRDGAKYSLAALQGKVGSSDVHGKVALDVSSERPMLVADITSTRLDQKDLAGFLGLPPPAKGKPRTPDQAHAAQELAASGKVLSSQPLRLERLRAMDADVHFKGEHMLAPDIALDSVEARLKLKHGKLTLTPLDFGVAGGHVSSTIELDASHDVIQTRGDATVSNLELKVLLPKLKDDPGSAGKLGGRIKFATKGNSPAQMAASGNGEIALIMSSGKARALALVLTNLDLANAIRYLLRGDPNGPIYCAVTHASMHDGKLVPDILVVDTSVEKITGEGNVDLAQEDYNLRLVAHSKHASLLALRGPIRIGGTFKNPKVHPEVAPLALRVGAAVALGTVLTPFASLLALVDTGGAKGADCSALIGQARQDVADSPVAPPKTAAPARSPQRPADAGHSDRPTR